MKAFPAIDLKDNKCVRLTKGVDDTSQIFNPDPVDQAIFFEQAGCSRLHIVDLDAAFGRKNINFNSVKKIRKAISIPIQMGGGIRSEDDAKTMFDLGINYLIIGSFSIKSEEKVRLLANKYEDKIYIALDLLNNKSARVTQRYSVQPKDRLRLKLIVLTPMSFIKSVSLAT